MISQIKKPLCPTSVLLTSRGVYSKFGQDLEGRGVYTYRRPTQGSLFDPRLHPYLQELLGAKVCHQSQRSSSALDQRNDSRLSSPWPYSRRHAHHRPHIWRHTKGSLTTTIDNWGIHFFSPHQHRTGRCSWSTWFQGRLWSLQPSFIPKNFNFWSRPIILTNTWRDGDLA